MFEWIDAVGMFIESNLTLIAIVFAAIGIYIRWFSDRKFRENVHNPKMFDEVNKKDDDNEPWGFA